MKLVFFSEYKYLEKLKVLQLKTCPSFHEFLEIVNSFNISDINEDNLFQEYITMKESFVSMQEKQCSFEVKWQLLLKACNVPNFERIINFIFSIPHSNAQSERIFSIMFNTWRKERNRLVIESVETELMVKHNYKFNCKEFYKFIYENDILLKKVKSGEKYA